MLLIRTPSSCCTQPQVSIRISSECNHDQPSTLLSKRPLEGAKGQKQVRCGIKGQIWTDRLHLPPQSHYHEHDARRIGCFIIIIIWDLPVSETAACPPPAQTVSVSSTAGWSFDLELKPCNADLAEKYNISETVQVGRRVGWMIVRVCGGQRN